MKSLRDTAGWSIQQFGEDEAFVLAVLCGRMAGAARGFGNYLRSEVEFQHFFSLRLSGRASAGKNAFAKANILAVISPLAPCLRCWSALDLPNTEPPDVGCYAIFGRGSRRGVELQVLDSGVRISGGPGGLSKTSGQELRTSSATPSGSWKMFVRFPGVSLRSTPGYCLASFQDARRKAKTSSAMK
jgi:hypothetical protein